jgi:murein DD-endopeptidase MepM/ murein hydrolase activator NlpD
MTQHTEDAVPQETMMADSVGKREVMALPSPDSAAAWSDSLSHIPTGTPIAGWITQEFSMNISGFGGEHPGLDFAAKTGTEVKTTADGQVSFVGWDEIYGFLVAIDHQNAYQTFYGHNSKILVEVGDNVRRGEVIALSGNTGRSSAPHLHYEIRQNEVPVNPSSSINRH